MCLSDCEKCARPWPRDDIGMIHEFIQVSRHNASNRVSWAEACLPNHWHIYLLLTNGLLHLYL